MRDATGHVAQTGMTVNPAVSEALADFTGVLLRGYINGVRPKDTNTARQTLCDVALLNAYPLLYNVPILASKINLKNGERADPEKGDAVVVGFLNGRACEPVVLGFLEPPNSSMPGKAADTPQYNWGWQGTTIQVRKDGSRVVHVAADETLDVVGEGTITIGGNLTINIASGNKLTVNGDMEVSGNFTATSVSDSAGSMATIRSTYNEHVHGSSPRPDPTM